MSKKKPRKSKKFKQNDNPTLFVLEGSIRYYKDGSMLELYSAINQNEWEMMVEETIKYKIFLECLKETAFPLLNETWTAEDEWFKLQLEVAVSRMRNIDPLLMMKWRVDDIKKTYTNAMGIEAAAVQKLIEDMKQQQKGALNTKVSDL